MNTFIVQAAMLKRAGKDDLALKAKKYLTKLLGLGEKGVDAAPKMAPIADAATKADTIRIVPAIKPKTPPMVFPKGVDRTPSTRWLGFSIDPSKLKADPKLEADAHTLATSRASLWNFEDEFYRNQANKTLIGEKIKELRARAAKTNTPSSDKADLANLMKRDTAASQRQVELEKLIHDTKQKIYKADRAIPKDIRLPVKNK